MNSVVLIGRVSRDIELKFVPSTGMAIASFNLAVDKGLFGEKKKEAESQGKPTADFLNIKVFGRSAENCANFLAKGSQCAIQGRVTTNNYKDQEGKMHYHTEITADRVEFLGSKADRQTKPQQDSHFFDDVSGENDMYQPVTDDSDIPF